jgi:superfamily II DNA or RNA helicase
MQPGDQVRIIDNPSRIGVLTSQDPIGEGRRRRLVVMFDDGLEPVLASTLEKVEAEVKDPFLLMQRGMYAGASHLRGAVTFYRLTGRLANLIYSLNTTNTRFLPYQFKPVLQYLDSPSRGIVIADEVGLGKTIEAGLIWTELRARQDAKRLLVVCPAMLQEKWCNELSSRFGVKAEIVNSAELHERLTKALDDSSEEFALVCSMQGMRPPKEWDSVKTPSNSAAAKLARFLNMAADEDPLLDLVVVDEAHYLRNKQTQTHRFAALLRPVTDGMVLLSATPIQMRSTDLFNLLHLLDQDAFPMEWTYDLSVNANAPIVALRDKLQFSVVSQEDFKNSLEQSVALRWYDDSEQVQHLLNNLPTDQVLATHRGRAQYADMLDRLNPRAKVITRTLKRDVSELRVQREPVTLSVAMTIAERQFYDRITDAVREYCEFNDISEGFLLTIPQRQMSSCMAAAFQGWRARLMSDELGVTQEELVELDADESERNDLSVDTKKSVGDPGELIQLLVSIANEYGDATALTSSDSKFNELFINLKTYWRDNPTKKVVLFAFYRNTLHYLARRLADQGVKAAVLHGGMDKQAVLNAFEDPSGPQILLSSEVASEGVDLQFSSLLVNYDLPWNPAKIEQRIGRIDRIGQDAPKILIWNMVYADTLDERVHVRLLERLNIFKSALGSMEEILGAEVRKLTSDLLSHKLTPEAEERRIEQSAIALENLRITQEQLDERSSQLLGHGDFIQNKAKAAFDLGRYIRGDDLYHYVKDFLEKNYPGSRLMVDGDVIRKGRIELSIDGRIDFGAFLVDTKLQGKTTILANSPHTLWFDNQTGNAPRGVEKVTQDHPLIRFISSKQKSGPIYFPTSALELPKAKAPDVAPGIYIYHIMRWEFSGPRDVEKLVYEVRILETGEALDEDKSESLVNAAALDGFDWHAGAKNLLNHSQVASLQDDCRASLEERFIIMKDSQQRENRDRIREMNASLDKDLERKRSAMHERISRHQTSVDPKYKQRVISGELTKLKNLEAKYEERKRANIMKESIGALPPKDVSSGVILIA